MARAYVAMTLEVDVKGDERLARHVAEELNSALSNLLRIGGAGFVNFSTITAGKGSEVNAVEQLLDSVRDFHQPKPEPTRKRATTANWGLRTTQQRIDFNNLTDAQQDKYRKLRDQGATHPRAFRQVTA
jgi:hypothetical protein